MLLKHFYTLITKITTFCVYHLFVLKSSNTFFTLPYLIPSCDKQQRFCERSYETQLITAINDFAECLNRNGQCDVLVADCNIAFDKVPHSLLFHKLFYHGIPRSTPYVVGLFPERHISKSSFRKPEKSLHSSTFRCAQGTVHASRFVSPSHTADTRTLLTSFTNWFKLVSRTERRIVLE